MKLKLVSLLAFIVGFFLSCIVIIFTHASAYSIDFGSITDWITSFSTLGLFIYALKGFNSWKEEKRLDILFQNKKEFIDVLVSLYNSLSTMKYGVIYYTNSHVDHNFIIDSSSNTRISIDKYMSYMKTHLKENSEESNKLDDLLQQYYISYLNVFSNIRDTRTTNTDDFCELLTSILLHINLMIKTQSEIVQKIYGSTQR
ncbi:TPA: hypothetical protein QB637_000348 [Pasteurella multocida]|nr:hypothetical protein [Pasteurella multocida]HED4406689.1 hypothetical protein [Pasteurella multocida]